MKFIRLKNPKVGDRAVVNEMADATIYTIDSIEGNIAKLSYLVRGVSVQGGEIHVGCLYQPTAQQLQLAAAEIRPPVIAVTVLSAPLPELLRKEFGDAALAMTTVYRSAPQMLAALRAIQDLNMIATSDAHQIALYKVDEAIRSATRDAIPPANNSAH